MVENIVRNKGKDFRLMVLGQIISIFGSALLRFALSLYVLDMTGRADVFASLFAISNIPIILSPLGGAIADRFNRRNLMVIYDFSSSLIVLCLLLIMRVGEPSLVVIGSVMVLLAIISSMYTPSVTASIPLLVPEAKIEHANGLVTAVQALSGVAAPVLGGLLYTAVGIKILVVVSCVSFFLSAVMEIFIQIPFARREQRGHYVLTIFNDLKDGFYYVIKQPFIRNAAILAALLNFILSPLLIVGAPIIFRQTLKSNDLVYGIGMGMIQAASILGALSVGMFSKRLNFQTIYRWLFMLAVLLLPMAFVVTPYVLGAGVTPSLILFTIGAVAIAAILNLLSVFVISRVQKQTPNENLGKVMAIIIMIAQCVSPIGQMLYGVLFERFQATVFIPILMVCIIMLILSRCYKQLLVDR